jgi:lipopolysaccharide transport system ATP-binding protein
VAAHLNAEILVVDEVLAVGDRQFQEKSLGKMGDIASEGRTVLFVSHNMAAITHLCSRAVLLNAGLVEMIGTSEEVARRYTATASQTGQADLRGRDRAASHVAFEWAELRDQDHNARQEFSVGESIVVAFGLRLPASLPAARLVVALKTADGMPLAHVVDHDSHFDLLPERSTEVQVCFEDFRFYPGTYYVSLYARDGTNTETLDAVEDVIRFDILDGGRLTPRPLPRHLGLIYLTPEWRQVLNQSGLRDSSAVRRSHGK